MSKKYEQLGEFLDAQRSGQVELSFDQIERLINRQLPASAHLYIAWWSNSAVQGRHNDTWLRRGWVVTHLNLKTLLKSQHQICAIGADGEQTSPDKTIP